MDQLRGPATPHLSLTATRYTIPSSRMVSQCLPLIDPYHGRPLTKGELGCFLSHYNIWKEVGPTAGQAPPQSSLQLKEGITCIPDGLLSSVNVSPEPWVGELLSFSCADVEPESGEG